jgi:hypothetical protein
MFANVGTSGTSIKQIQLGNGSFITTGYLGSTVLFGAAFSSSTNITTGAGMYSNLAADRLGGSVVFSLQTGNTWVWQGNIGVTGAGDYFAITGGSLALSSALDRVRITTVNGTDTFASGAINITYE